MPIWRRSGRLLLAVVLLVGAASCGIGSGGGPGGDPDQRPPAGTTESARTYGYGPVRDRSVTYQPDVVLIGGGPEAIRSASANGLTWTIDGDAEGAGDLEPGKVMYVTSRAVGRVVDVSPVDGDLAVTVEPVALTEVFRDAHFVSDRQLDDAALVYQEVPELPGALSIPTEPMTPGAVVTPTGLTTTSSTASDQAETVLALNPIRLAAAPGPRLPPARERNFTVTVGEWEAQPYRTPGKLGLKIGYAANKNLKVYIDFSMNVNNLRVRTDVPISNGKIGSDATFVVEGIDSIAVDVSAGAANGADDNKKVRVEVPVEMTWQIPGEPLVYSNTWKFIVTTGLSGKNTTVTAAGEWAVSGAIGMISGTVQTPKLSVVKSIMDSITGISIGPSGLAFAVETKIQFGIGITAAFAGPYAKLVVDLGVTNGSALGSPLARCVSASLGAKVGGGFGVTVSSTALADLQDLLPKELKFELETEKLWPIHRASQTLPDVPLCIG